MIKNALSIVAFILSTVVAMQPGVADPFPIQQTTRGIGLGTNFVLEIDLDIKYSNIILDVGPNDAEVNSVAQDAMAIRYYPLRSFVWNGYYEAENTGSILAGDLCVSLSLNGLIFSIAGSEVETESGAHASPILSAIGIGYGGWLELSYFSLLYGRTIGEEGERRRYDTGLLISFSPDNFIGWIASLGRAEIGSSTEDTD